MLDTADLDTFAAALRDAGLRSVDYDPAKVNPPGAWLRVDTLTQLTLAGGCEIALTAFLVVPASGGVTRSLTKLSELLDLTTPALDALARSYGAATVTGLVLPGSSTPLPALSVPVTLHTTP